MSLYAKLAEVVTEVGRVPKKGRNDFHKYDYVREEDLLEAIRGALAKRQIALLPSAPTVVRDGTLTTVHMTFTFADGESGETHTVEWAGTGEDKGDKGLYKAYTGALKYFLMKTFLIPTGDDPEDDKAASPPARPAVKRPAPPSATNGKPADTIDPKTVVELEDKIREHKLRLGDVRRLLAAVDVDGAADLADGGKVKIALTRLSVDQATALEEFIAAEPVPA